MTPVSTICDEYCRTEITYLTLFSSYYKYHNALTYTDCVVIVQVLLSVFTEKRVMHLMH